MSAASKKTQAAKHFDSSQRHSTAYNIGAFRGNAADKRSNERPLSLCLRPCRATSGRFGIQSIVDCFVPSEVARSSFLAFSVSQPEAGRYLLHVYRPVWLASNRPNPFSSAKNISTLASRPNTPLQ